MHLKPNARGKYKREQIEMYAPDKPIEELKTGESLKDKFGEGCVNFSELRDSYGILLTDAERYDLDWIEGFYTAPKNYGYSPFYNAEFVKYMRGITPER